MATGGLCVNEGQKPTLGVVPQGPPTLFNLGQGPTVVWNSPSRLVWLPNKPQRTSCLIADITSMCYHIICLKTIFMHESFIYNISVLLPPPSNSHGLLKSFFHGPLLVSWLLSAFRSKDLKLEFTYERKYLGLLIIGPGYFTKNDYFQLHLFACEFHHSTVETTTFSFSLKTNHEESLFSPFIDSFFSSNIVWMVFFL